MKHGEMRQRLANAVSAWLSAQLDGSEAAKTAEREAMDLLVAGLNETDEELAGIVWDRAHQVAICWKNSLPMRRAMLRLVDAFVNTIGGSRGNFDALRRVLRRKRR